MEDGKREPDLGKDVPWARGSIPRNRMVGLCDHLEKGTFIRDPEAGFWTYFLQPCPEGGPLFLVFLDWL